MNGLERGAAAAVMLLALGSAASVAAESRSNAKVSFRGNAWTAADAIAFGDGAGRKARTIVVFSSVAFDRKDFTRDGVIDERDIAWHWDAHPNARGFRMTIPAASGDRVDAMHVYDGGSQSGAGIDRPRGIRLVAGKVPRIAGKLKDEDGAYDLDFDLAVEGKVEPAVDYLPDDGGEPGKAVGAFMEARAADAYSRMASLIHPKRDVLMAKDAPRTRYLAAASRATSCRKLTAITGGHVFADEALVGFSCDYGQERELRGVAVLARDGADWKVVGFLQERIHE